MDRFAQILYDLGKEIGIKLYPDENRICEIDYRGVLHIQLEFDETKEQLLISTLICETPPGKFREKVLKEALKCNALYPRVGTLAYSESNNRLVLFSSVPNEACNERKLFALLEAFIKESEEWKEAIEQGKSLPSHAPNEEPGGGMFGLKP
ncbi:MAG: hypothetical protein KR126chlam1_00106 [Chlamydiae bacterium]|nr:hypothetical protein [Chlamydiota bacterium]